MTSNEKITLARVTQVNPVMKWALVGSQVTCNPAPDTGDFDVLVLVEQNAETDYHRYLMNLGFEHGVGSEGPWMNGYFETYRLGQLNLIVTYRPRMYDRFMMATDLAKRFNLLDKKDRVDLFEAIGTNGDDCEQSTNTAEF